ncbi:MAG: hypothetical protein ACRD26_08830 [Vicinamibacterales bacterium]
MCLGPDEAGAQAPARFSLDSAVSVDLFRGQNTSDEPSIIVDITAVARLADGWLLYVRPWFRQPRLPGIADPENWDKEIYQAALQYERNGRISTRVDAGYIASPIGLGMMDTRPGVNPTIAPHLAYLQPMPAFDPGAPRVSAIAATYPLGGQLTLSTTRWDARAAVISSAPMRASVINGDDNPPTTPVVVTGAGITPLIGLRIGASFAAGAYVAGEELTVPQDDDRRFRMVNVEADYAFRYTRISGEITHNRLDAAAGRETARAWFVQAVQTLSPRWFAAARQEGVSAPPLRTATSVGPRRTFHTTEATLGYRLSPELTLRVSGMSRKAYTRTAWDQQIGASVVWARRWW